MGGRCLVRWLGDPSCQQRQGREDAGWIPKWSYRTPGRLPGGRWNTMQVLTRRKKAGRGLHLRRLQTWTYPAARGIADLIHELHRNLKGWALAGTRGLLGYGWLAPRKRLGDGRNLAMGRASWLVQEKQKSEAHVRVLWCYHGGIWQKLILLAQ